MADSLSNSDYIICQHITIGGHFLSILMFIRENRKHIGLFWWYKFMLFFFSDSTVCVSFRGRRNVLVYLRSVLALNGLVSCFLSAAFCYDCTRLTCVSVYA